MTKMADREPGTLTCQEEEDTPRDGDAALGDGVAVSNPSALHADHTEDHGHKAQEHGHHHQGSRGLDVTWAERGALSRHWEKRAGGRSPAGQGLGQGPGAPPGQPPAAGVRGP